jgi:hypothetical protein
MHIEKWKVYEVKKYTYGNYMHVIISLLPHRDALERRMNNPQTIPFSSMDTPSDGEESYCSLKSVQTILPDEEKDPVTKLTTETSRREYTTR